VPAGTHGPLREEFAHANAQAENRWAGKHPAFPARWSDGLYALSPEPSSFWPPSPRELTMPSGPVGPQNISARLDRSNDDQDHALSPYAARPAPPRRASRERWRRPFRRMQGPHEVHLALVPPTHARRSRVHRTPALVRHDVRSPLSAGRDGAENAAIPNFGKVEYFCGGGLTGVGVFCPTANWHA